MRWFVLLGFSIVRPAMMNGETSCLPVRGETIVAADLAAANPVFAALPPETPLSAVPTAGARRVFRGTELARLIRQYQLSTGPLRDVCFEWPAEVLAPAKLAATMAAVLDCDSNAIEILDQSRFPAPAGELVFSKKDMEPIAGADVRDRLWRGFVRYGPNWRFPIWARIRIPASLAISAPRAAASPPEVQAGNPVQVEVRNGAMRIYFTAKAERSGRIGDTIPMSNPESFAHFRARVEDRDLVVVMLRPQ